MNTLVVPKAIWPYISKDAGSYSAQAIAAFHSVTGGGASLFVESSKLTKEQALELKDLFDGQSCLRIPSGIVEGIWVDGQRDYPVRVMLRDMIREGIGHRERWLVQLPLFERAYRLSVYIHNTACRYVLATGGQHDYKVRMSYPPNVRIARCNMCGFQTIYAV